MVDTVAGIAKFKWKTILTLFLLGYCYIFPYVCNLEHLAKTNVKSNCVAIKSNSMHKGEAKKTSCFLDNVKEKLATVYTRAGMWSPEWISPNDSQF